ncbi:MAG: hypothetical protein Q8N96_06225 [Methylovulum sp.]|nr:hypothetical protein [Methylovulum sp.]
MSDNFVIVDTASNRLLKYSSACQFMGAVTLPKNLVGATDIEVLNGYWVLDSSAQIPTIWHLTYDGKELEKFSSPVKLEDGLSGIFIDQNGEIAVEGNGFTKLLQLLPPFQTETEIQKQKQINYGTKIVNDQKGGNGIVQFDGNNIELNTDQKLIGLKILKVTNDKRFFVAVDEEQSTHVDETIRQYSHDGTIVGVARIPAQTRIYLG